MFSDEELNTLIQLLDVATKSGGLIIAEKALPLAIKAQNELVARRSVDDQTVKA